MQTQAECDHSTDIESPCVQYSQRVRLLYITEIISAPCQVTDEHTLLIYQTNKLQGYYCNLANVQK